MALHRLTSITLGVPDVDASANFFTDFGLTPTGTSGLLATRDGGGQVELTTSPTRRLHRLGVGAADGDDLARLASRARDTGTDVVEATEERLVVREPVTGLLVDVTVAEPYDATSTGHTYNRPGRPRSDSTGRPTAC